MTARFDDLADRLAERVVAAMVEVLEERDAAPVPLLDASQLARYLGVHRSLVYSLAKSGRLPAIGLAIPNGRRGASTSGSSPNIWP